MADSDTHMLSDVEIDDNPAAVSQEDSVFSVSSSSYSANSGGVKKTQTTTVTMDTASSENDETMMEPKKDDFAQDEAQVQKLCRDVLKYIIRAEETQMSGSFFCKDFTKDEDTDWTENHFLMKQEGNNFGVFYTSYQHASIVKKLGLQSIDSTKPPPASSVDSAADGHSTRTYWLKIPCPQSSSEKPTVTEETDTDVRRYLEHIQGKSPERFQNCQDLNYMIPLLQAEDIPPPEKGFETIRAFIMSAVGYTNSASMDIIRPVYDKLYHWHSKVNTGRSAELFAGFGHVRMVYKNKQDETRIVNGALFEVPLEVKFKRGANGYMEIFIFPAKDAQISLNSEVMSAIIAGGGGNSHYLEKLYNLVGSTEVTSLRLDNSDSYNEILQIVQMLRCRGEVRSANDPNVHVRPRDLEALVVTDAWCFLTRKSSSTVFSTDARNIMEALDQKKMEIPAPIRALLCGPEFLTKCKTGATDRLQEDQLVCPLPTSEQQKEACVRLLVNGEPVFIVEGPPGTFDTLSSAQKCMSYIL